MANTFGIIALILGIVGLFVFPIVFGIVAIILGAVGKNKDDSPGLAIAGIVLGIIDLVLWIILTFVLIGLFTSMI